MPDRNPLCTDDIDILSARLLTPEQYCKIYTTSARDGYRVQLMKKKDSDKHALIQNRLGGASL